MNRLFAVWFCAMLMVTTAWTAVAQPVSPPAKDAAAVKRKVETLAPLAKISVVRRHDRELFGAFVRSDDHSFTMRDIDENTDVTLTFEEVRTVKDGYGGYNAVQHRHVDRTHVHLVVGATVVVLAILIGAVAATR